MIDSSSRKVLILSATDCKDVADQLFALGYYPSVRKDMQAALDAIRHHRYRALLFDLRHSRIDALEFILNVRDIDQQADIILINSSPKKSEQELLCKQDKVYLLSNLDSIQHWQ